MAAQAKLSCYWGLGEWATRHLCPLTDGFVLNFWPQNFYDFDDKFKDAEPIFLVSIATPRKKTAFVFFCGKTVENFGLPTEKESPDVFISKTRKRFECVEKNDDAAKLSSKIERQLELLLKRFV